MRSRIASYHCNRYRIFAGLDSLSVVFKGIINVSCQNLSFAVRNRKSGAQRLARMLIAGIIQLDIYLIFCDIIIFRMRSRITSYHCNCYRIFTWLDSLSVVFECIINVSCQNLSFAVRNRKSRTQRLARMLIAGIIQLDIHFIFSNRKFFSNFLTSFISTDKGNCNRICTGLNSFTIILYNIILIFCKDITIIIIN